MQVAVKTEVSVGPEAFMRMSGALTSPKLGDWSLSVTGARSSAAHSLDLGETRTGTPSGLWHRNVALLGGFMSPAVCPSCSFWEMAEIPLLLWEEHLLGITSAGMTLVLSKHTDSLDSRLKNLNCADFTFKEISLMSFRNQKKNKKAVSFSFLVNLLRKSGTLCISLFEKVLTSEI